MRRPTSVAAPVIGRRMDSQARQDALGHMARMGTQPGRPVAHALGRPPVVEHGVSRTCLLRTPMPIPRLRSESVALWQSGSLLSGNHALFGVATTSRPVRAKGRRSVPGQESLGGIDRASRLNPAGALRAALTPLGWAAIWHAPIQAPPVSPDSALTRPASPYGPDFGTRYLLPPAPHLALVTACARRTRPIGQPGRGICAHSRHAAQCRAAAATSTTFFRSGSRKRLGAASA